MRGGFGGGAGLIAWVAEAGGGAAAVGGQQAGPVPRAAPSVTALSLVQLPWCSHCTRSRQVTAGAVTWDSVTALSVGYPWVMPLLGYAAPGCQPPCPASHCVGQKGGRRGRSRPSRSPLAALHAADTVCRQAGLGSRAPSNRQQRPLAALNAIFFEAQTVPFFSKVAGFCAWCGARRACGFSGPYVSKAGGAGTTPPHPIDRVVVCVCVRAC